MESKEGVAIFCGDEDSRGWIRKIILAVIFLQFLVGFHSGEWRVGGWQSLYWPDEWPWQPSLGRWFLRLKIGSLSQRTGLRPRGEIGVEPPSHRWWRKSKRGSAGWSEATSFGGAILVRNGPRLQAIQKGAWVEKRAGQWPSLFSAKVVGDFPRDEDLMPHARWHERWSCPPPILVATAELSRCSVEPASLRFHCESNRLET